VENPAKKKWRAALIATELIFLCSGVVTITISQQTDLRTYALNLFEKITAGAFSASTLILLLGSPFLLRTQRHLALIGWLLAFGSLLYFLLTPVL
jgi:hypothetical protein